jgi:hypothetical protein
LQSNWWSAVVIIISGITLIFGYQNLLLLRPEMSCSDIKLSQATNLQAFILTDSRESSIGQSTLCSVGIDFIRANREGVFGSAGFFAIHLLGLGIGVFLKAQFVSADRRLNFENI